MKYGIDLSKTPQEVMHLQARYAEMHLRIAALIPHFRHHLHPIHTSPAKFMLDLLGVENFKLKSNCIKSGSWCDMSPCSRYQHIYPCCQFKTHSSSLHLTDKNQVFYNAGNVYCSFKLVSLTSEKVFYFNFKKYIYKGTFCY